MNIFISNITHYNAAILKHVIFIMKSITKDYLYFFNINELFKVHHYITHIIITLNFLMFLHLKHKNITQM
jgi:hypothetical protein